MPSWEDVTFRKVDLLKEAFGFLSKEEVEILSRVMELEWNNRHLAHQATASEIRKTLRNYIIQEFK